MTLIEHVKCFTALFAVTALVPVLYILTTT